MPHLCDVLYLRDVTQPFTRSPYVMHRPPPSARDVIYGQPPSYFPLFAAFPPFTPLTSRTNKIQLGDLGEHCKLSGVSGGTPAEIEFGAL